jgi:hypothetical protein
MTKRKIDMFPPLPKLVGKTTRLNNAGTLRAFRMNVEDSLPDPMKSSRAKSELLRAVSVKASARN